MRGIEVVLPTGEITLFNGKMKRNNAGYDLMQLMIGSEGTLGIVTKIMLSVRPKLPCDATIIAAFDNYSQAADAVTMSLKTGIHLDGIEYMDRSTAKKCAANTGKTWPLNKGKVDLMFIVCAENEEAAFNICQMVESICSMAGAVESRTYDGADKQKEFIEMRTTSLFATQNNMAETMDIAVPPAEVPRLMKVFHEISEKYNIVTDTVGHISEGNVHNNVYAEKDGSLATGWKQINNKWYFFDYYSGVMTTTGCDTSPIGTAHQSYYAFDANGVWIQGNGWKKAGCGDYVYLKNSKCVTGWVKDNGKWYYLDPYYDAEMSRSYYVTDDEEAEAPYYMYTYVDGYYIDVNGVCRDGGYKWHKDKRGWWYGKGKYYEKSSTAYIDEYECTFDSEGYLMSTYSFRTGEYWIEYTTGVVPAVDAGKQQDLLCIEARRTLRDNCV